jgi:hypothetical protein
MKVTLFDDNIAGYDTIIKQNQEYIISNATIKPVDPKYQTRENEYDNKHYHSTNTAVYDVHCKKRIV